MSKNKVYLYDHFCDPESGYSEVSLMTPQGIFIGSASCNLDEDTFNEITGGSLAELRAWKAYYKYERKLRKFAKKEFTTLYSQMKKNYMSQPVLDYIEFLELEIEKCDREIELIEEELAARIARLDKSN